MTEEKKSFISIRVNKKEIKAYLHEIIFQENGAIIRSEIDRQSLIQALKEAADGQPEEKRRMILDFVEKQERELKNLN
jgi:hypothetical protein